MKQCLCIITAVLLATAAGTGCMDARPKAVSSIWSLSSIGIGYEYTMDERSFGQVEMCTEMSDMFFGRGGITGVAASFTWNMIFAKAESRNGNTVSFYSGPGAVLGWSKDLGGTSGGIFGLKGRIGAECVFERKIAVSIGFAPILGMHVSAKDDIMSMRLYRNGLMYSLSPEIGIKYAF